MHHCFPIVAKPLLRRSRFRLISTACLSCPPEWTGKKTIKSKPLRREWKKGESDDASSPNLCNIKGLTPGAICFLRAAAEIGETETPGFLVRVSDGTAKRVPPESGTSQR